MSKNKTSVQFNTSLNHAINDFDITNENRKLKKIKRKSLHDSINLIDNLIGNK
jgi:hypothetical protein